MKIRASSCLILATIGFLLSCKSAYIYNEERILDNKSIDKIIAVFDTSFLATAKDVSSIPKKAIRFLNKIGKEKFRIVNPNEKYQATDVVNGLPPRRLETILQNGRYFIMSYDHGGRGRHHHLMFFEFERGKIIDFWVGYGYGQTTSEMKNSLIDRSRLQTNFVDF